MENNEIMNNNEEVIETTTEEIVKAASNGGMKKATTIGLAMIAGALTYKFVVVPATAKFKNWRENRKTVVTQPKGDIVDGEFTDIDEETEEDSALSSLNPEIERITARKPKLYALNKADLADPAVTEEWIKYFRAADAGCVGHQRQAEGRCQCGKGCHWKKNWQACWNAARTAAWAVPKHR